MMAKKWLDSTEKQKEESIWRGMTDRGTDNESIVDNNDS